MIDLQLPIIKFKSFADEKMKLASSQDEWLNCLINTDSEWDICIILLRFSPKNIEHDRRAPAL